MIGRTSCCGEGNFGGNFRGGCPGHSDTDVSLSILASRCGRRPFVIINPSSYKHSLERYIHSRYLAHPTRYQSSTMGSKIRSIVDSAADKVSQEALVASSLGLAIVVGFWLLRKIRHGKKYKLPPRVPGVPIFGNTFQIPALQQGPWAKGLAEKYGEMFVLYAVVPTP